MTLISGNLAAGLRRKIDDGEAGKCLKIKCATIHFECPSFNCNCEAGGKQLRKRHDLSH